MIPELEMIACAKINLGLDVVGRRPDGYHEVRMIMQSVGLHDSLRMSRNTTGEIRLRVEPKSSCISAGPDNLVWRAVDIVRQEYGIKDGVDVALSKNIPVCAGLGGGSSDAAAAIRGMNTLFEVGMTEERMRELGGRLGADVPFCVIGGTALAEGIGEKLTSLERIPDCSILIVKPDIDISTPVVYKALDRIPSYEHPDIDIMAENIRKGDLAAVCRGMGNVLELVTASEYPEVGAIADRMRQLGAVNSMMSGSGPSVFGIFDDREKAEKALLAFKSGPYAQSSYLTEPV